MSIRPRLILFIAFCISPFIISACSLHNPTTPSVTAEVVVTETAMASPEPSITAIPATPTPVPLAIVINGEPITLAEFNAELERYKATLEITGTILASDTKTVVLNELIDQTLLAQSAVEDGFVVDDTMLQAKITSLENQLGGADALEAWQFDHGYSSVDFGQALRRSISAAWMRDQIIATVPETAEEVHVLQILLPTAAEAEEVYASLESGEDFKELAATYEPLTSGDLGWFPRGYLGELNIEEAAFALQPGEYSAIIETEVGFHILYLVEKDPNHKLLPDARLALQGNAVQEWLKERRSKSDIQILVP